MNKRLIMFLLFLGGFTCQADAFQVSEAEAIKQLEAIGGRVMTIAADTEDREVSLYLAGDKVDDEKVALLRSVSNIKWLNLANTAVTDAGLAPLQNLKLEKLHLEKTGIGDKGLAHLKNQTELVYLNLYGTNVTNEGLRQLAGLSKLKKLYLWQSKVDEDGMAWLKAELPDLVVVGAVNLNTDTNEEAAKDEKKMEVKEREKATEDKKDSGKE